jgi:RHS repeat-associated protein
MAFAPFGERYIGAVSDNFFTGSGQNVEANDLWKFPARELHNIQGRWLTPDPAGLASVDLTDPQTLNRYAYVRNNPLGLVDPTGMDPCSQYASNGATPNAGSYTQCEAEQNMYRGSDLAYGWSDPFQLSQIPVTQYSYVSGVPPSALSAQWWRGSNASITISYFDTPQGSWQPLTIGTFGWIEPDMATVTGGLQNSQTGPPKTVPAVTTNAPPKKPGTYSAYAGCLLAAWPNVIARAAVPGAVAATAGTTLTNPVSPPADILRKAPPRELGPGLKWGTGGQIVGALLFLGTYEAELNAAARSCSNSVGYTPWVFE